MFLSGFTDEASADFATQLQATRELGWHYLESRDINGKNLATLTDEEFERCCAMLEEQGISISCYGSGIANWSKHPRKPEDFEASVQELTAAIPRMKRLGITLVRGMSFLTPSDEAPDNPELEKIIFSKLRTLVQICADNGIIYGHENCMNYGGLSYNHTLKMLEEVDNPSLKLIFDTGNPCFNYRWIGNPPYPMQSSWEFYKMVREHIVYIHIKDGMALPRQDLIRPEGTFTYPGEGCADVRAIMKDLLDTGYDGGFSIEPHMAVVFHAPSAASDGESEADNQRRRYENYISYGHRFEQLLMDCGWKLEK